jgi:hypothetical protein
MVKLLLIFGLIAVALTTISLLAKLSGSQQNADRSFERIAWFGGIAIIAVIVLLACGHFAGGDYIASALQRFLHWLNS